MKNNKGFTLIELLTVIVILGVVSTIAIPSVNNVINNSKKRAFVADANFYVDAVKTAVMQHEYDVPVDKNDVTVISLNVIDMDSENINSPYGSKWIDNKSYVAVTNEGTSIEPKYVYYFAAQDEDRNAIPLTNINDITTKSITNEARNTMEVTVQSLAGDITGAKSVKSNISGLKNAIENGEKQDWDVTIYTK